MSNFLFYSILFVKISIAFFAKYVKIYLYTKNIININTVASKIFNNNFFKVIISFMMLLDSRVRATIFYFILFLSPFSIDIFLMFSPISSFVNSKAITNLAYLKRKKLTIDNGYDNKTIVIGKGDGRTKIYNKKLESDLKILGDLTRVEVSRELDDFPINEIKTFKFDKMFPCLYLNKYMYSFKDYEDKTLLALLYAVQNNFPITELTRTYKKKIKDLLEGGYRIKFDERSAYFYYFINNEKVRFK